MTKEKEKSGEEERGELHRNAHRSISKGKEKLCERGRGKLLRYTHGSMSKKKERVGEEGSGRLCRYAQGSSCKEKEETEEDEIEELGTCPLLLNLNIILCGDSSKPFDNDLWASGNKPPPKKILVCEATENMDLDLCLTLSTPGCVLLANSSGVGSQDADYTSKLSSNDSWVSWDIPPPKKILVYEEAENSGLDLCLTLSTPGCVFRANSSRVGPQDADYTYTFSLSEELELRILSRLSLPDYWKLCQLNKTYLSLFKSGELFKIRRELGIRQLCVFTLASGDKSWWLFDERFEFRKRLPLLPSDDTFSGSDKETLCAGTHLLVVGWECSGHTIWRYELATNSWSRGPSMINPRSLFGSATCGESAFVAGGVCGLELGEILNSAEKYNAETRSWESLPKMNQRRKLCAGACMDNKFYVVGGRNEQGEYLTSGEVLYEDKNHWAEIPGMLEDSAAQGSASPPLIAVVNNELYLIHTSSNELKLYLKESNTWKNMGHIPVRADFLRGWGVAFKSLGDELLVMGRSVVHDRGDWMTIYTCRPDPNGRELEWKLVDVRQDHLRDFIYNCSIMAA